MTTNAKATAPASRASLAPAARAELAPLKDAAGAELGISCAEAEPGGSCHRCRGVGAGRRPPSQPKRERDGADRGRAPRDAATASSTPHGNGAWATRGEVVRRGRRPPRARRHLLWLFATALAARPLALLPLGRRRRPLCPPTIGRRRWPLAPPPLGQWRRLLSVDCDNRPPLPLSFIGDDV